ncbi:dystrophin-like [Ctenocephalides felis]|uniref:dystrophin-like n=1 Tax=Ctenocephalides felis TaxID=7515 RepID=UPI000E6E5A90|nr:dystrophin-like [Ctenocephalides felis]
MTECVNQRYANLTQAVVARGRVLNAAINSLHNFDRSLEKFLAWLSEAESCMEAIESETDRTPAGTNSRQRDMRMPQHQLKSTSIQTSNRTLHQLTQKLIAVYQHDDTSRIKKMTECVNQRYANLTQAVVARGRVLNAAINSLHNFDRSLEKFLAWLSEAESCMEAIESETDRTPAGTNSRQRDMRMPQHQLKIQPYFILRPSVGASIQQFLSKIQTNLHKGAPMLV